MPTVLISLQKRGLTTRWKKIGVLLQVPYPDLEIIKRNEDDEEGRMMATLNKWLTSGNASKEALANALQVL